MPHKRQVWMQITNWPLKSLSLLVITTIINEPVYIIYF